MKHKHESKKVDLGWMPFFVGDWQKAPEIRALPLDTRMVWFEMICIMWECEERGVLSIAGKPIDAATLSRMLGLDVCLLTNHLNIMQTLRVYSVRNDGAIYSRRMVSESALSAKRSKAGKKGGLISSSKRQANLQANTQALSES